MTGTRNPNPNPNPNPSPTKSMEPLRSVALTFLFAFAVAAQSPVPALSSSVPSPAPSPSHPRFPPKQHTSNPAGNRNLNPNPNPIPNPNHSHRGKAIHCSASHLGCRRPPHPGASAPPPPGHGRKLNSGETVGIVLAGIAVALQVSLAAFLVYKRLQMGKAARRGTRLGASSSASSF